MKNPNIPSFETKEELYDYLVENKADLIYAKKMELKKEDSLGTFKMTYVSDVKGIEETFKAYKADNPVTEIKVRAIINTTNVMDSHKDVHVAGIWNRSIKNNKNVKMLQEHEMRFDKIIADKEDLEVYVKEYDWRELGYDAEGKTQALVFDATVKESRNKFMFDEYKDGNVDNHSVGMRYVQIKLAVNSDKEDYKNEKEVWDKYFPGIVNGDEAKGAGYFWAVLEAKVIEGSAVVLGSNQITPTLARTKVHPEEEQTQPDAKSLEEKAINNLLKI
jgi:hypothetical protein